MKLHVYPAIRCFHKISDFLVMFPLSEKEFEKEFEKWVGGKKALYTYRARTGLFHLLSYLKNKFGVKRVIVPSYTCKEVVHPIKKIGLDIVFVDNNLETLGIDESDVNIESGDAILWVNYFGLKSKLPKKIANSTAFVIEDNASYFLPPSDYADFTLYSLGKGKEFSSGEGGIVVVNRNKFNDFVDSSKLRPSFLDNIYRFFDYLLWRIMTLRVVYIIGRKIRMLLIHDKHKEFDFSAGIDGLELSLSPISKRFGYKQITRLNELQIKSKVLWKAFVEKLKNVRSVKVLTSDKSNYFSINFLADQRDRLQKFLESRGVFASIPWNYLVGTELTGKRFENSSKILEKLLQIKIDPTFMKEDDVTYITDCVKEFYKSV